MAQPKRIVIVGGVAGGASAAARARRLSEDAQIVLFERGEHISFANCGLPYHIEGRITDRQALLVQTPQRMHEWFRIDVRTRTEITRIDREAKEVVAVDRVTGREYRESYDALVLSPGAEPVRPPIPGAKSPLVFTLRNLDDTDLIAKQVTLLAGPPGAEAGTGDMDAMIGPIEPRKPRRAVIVGGGYIGLEMAEALRGRGLDVTLVELIDQVMGPIDREMASPLHEELRHQGVDLRLNTSVTRFDAAGDGLRVELSTGESISCGVAVLAVGVRPEVTLARDAGLDLGPCGGIAVDEHLRTSDPDIFAVGDAVEVRDVVSGRETLIPLAGPANRQGRLAADNILGRASVYRGTQGTAICKVFDLAIGMTGLSEKALRKAGIQYEKVYVHPLHHAGYYPGAVPMCLKLLFSPDDGRVLGAQAVGREGIDKRIDVLAAAIQARMTVFDLEEIELAYAPPYGSAKDPVNYAGFVAANALRGDGPLCHVEEVLSLRDDQLPLDVRMADEVAGGTIPGARHIPLGELRDRLGELPRDKEILAFCQIGLRGYLACRILAQHGFRCRNITGGYKTYLMTTSR
ncbi:MAG: FAD-dependent oxidoreductase [Pirellulales bacterium]|nr:FAD-dependent oxidoreductase [Pirellulales bacterium]